MSEGGLEHLEVGAVPPATSPVGEERGVRGLVDMVGTWRALHRMGTKPIHHPLIGDLDLAQEAVALTADDGLLLNAFTAESGSASADALNMLAS